MSKMSFTTRIAHICLSIIEAIVIAIVYVWRVFRKPDIHGDLRFGISTMLSSAKMDGSITIERGDGERVYPFTQSWRFRATSPDGETETFKNYDTPKDARAAMKRLHGKGYTDFNGPTEEEDEATEAVISHLRSEGYVIDDRDAAEIRAHLKAMLESLGYEQSFDDLVASVMAYKNLTTDSGCQADGCAGCETPCAWNGDWYIDATSPMGERDTFGSYLEEADAREAIKRLQDKGYTDFNGPYQS
jgi:hypothetical protein